MFSCTVYLNADLVKRDRTSFNAGRQAVSMKEVIFYVQSRVVFGPGGCNHKSQYDDDTRHLEMDLCLFLVQCHLMNYQICTRLSDQLSVWFPLTLARTLHMQGHDLQQELPFPNLLPGFPISCVSASRTLHTTVVGFMATINGAPLLRIGKVGNPQNT